jgi:hydroxyacylglutathione hydrolase
LDLEDFRDHQDKYSIVDVRNSLEVSENPIFSSSISIPLADLKSRIDEIPHDKPIAVHCAGGYRSAIGSSLIDSLIGEGKAVYDIGEHIKEFDEQPALE